MIQYCKCGSIITNGKCSNKACGGEKHKGYYIYGAWFDFNEPVTYEEALVTANRIMKIANKAIESGDEG